MLGAPVVLIVDCTKASGTVAAVVLGCKQYDAAVSLRGVILNNVAPGRHEKVVREAIEQSSGLPVVGAVPVSAKEHSPNGTWVSRRSRNIRTWIRRSAARGPLRSGYLDLDALGISPMRLSRMNSRRGGLHKYTGHDASLTPVTIGSFRIRRSSSIIPTISRHWSSTGQRSSGSMP